MLPNGAQKVINDEQERMDSYDKNEIKKKMLEQGVYAEDEINSLFDEEGNEQEVINVFMRLGVNTTTSFFDFYKEIGFPPLGKGEELYTFDQIIENTESDFHSDEHPEIGKRYLQFTSIEGEGSYFYDKETDAVYDVNWGEEADMISGKKQPWFTSFHSFLEWYYGDNEE